MVNIVKLNKYLNDEVNVKFKDFAANVTNSMNTINDNLTSYSTSLKSAFDEYKRAMDIYLESLGEVVTVQSWNSSIGELRLTTKQFTAPELILDPYKPEKDPTVQPVTLNNAPPPTQVGFDPNGWLNTKDENGNVNPTGKNPITQAAHQNYKPNNSQIKEPDYASNEYTPDTYEPTEVESDHYTAPEFDANKYNPTEVESNADAIRDTVTKFDEYGYALENENNANWQAAQDAFNNAMEQQKNEFDEAMKKQQEDFAAQLEELKNQYDTNMTDKKETSAEKLQAKQDELDWYNEHNTKLLQLQKAMYDAKAELDEATNAVNVAQADINNNQAGVNAAQAAITTAKQDKENHLADSEAAQACDVIISAQTAIKNQYNTALGEARTALSNAESAKAVAKIKYDNAQEAYNIEAAKTYGK